MNKSIFASHTSNPKGHIILLIYLISLQKSSNPLAYIHFDRINDLIE